MRVEAGCIVVDGSIVAIGSTVVVVYLKALALMPAMMLLRLPESDMRDGGLSEFILSTAALVMSRFEVVLQMVRCALPSVPLTMLINLMVVNKREEGGDGRQGRGRS